jgi:hypothetical protein
MSGQQVIKSLNFDGLIMNQTTSIATIAGAFTPAILGTIQYGNARYFNINTPTKFIIFKKGVYRIESGIYMSSSAGNYGVEIYKNGTNVKGQLLSTGAGVPSFLSVSTSLYLNINDYIEIISYTPYVVNMYLQTTSIQYLGM